MIEIVKDETGCQKTFERREKLERHYRRHTNKGTHPCDFPGCGKSLSRSDKLTSHKRLHERKCAGKCPHKTCRKKLTTATHITDPPAAITVAVSTIDSNYHDVGILTGRLETSAASESDMGEAPGYASEIPMRGSMHHAVPMLTLLGPPPSLPNQDMDYTKNNCWVPQHSIPSGERSPLMPPSNQDPLRATEENMKTTFPVDGVASPLLINGLTDEVWTVAISDTGVAPSLTYESSITSQISTPDNISSQTLVDAHKTFGTASFTGFNGYEESYDLPLHQYRNVPTENPFCVIQKDEVYAPWPVAYPPKSLSQEYHANLDFRHSLDFWHLMYHNQLLPNTHSQDGSEITV